MQEQNAVPILFTILSYEDDLCSSGFQSLQEWWVCEFEEGNEKGDKREWCDGAHSPFKSSQDENFHSVDCLRIKDETLVALFQKHGLALDLAFDIWVIVFD